MAESDEYVSTRKFGIPSKSGGIEQFEVTVTVGYDFKFLSRPAYAIEIKRENSPEGLGTMGFSKEHLTVISEHFAKELIKKNVISSQVKNKFLHEAELSFSLAAVDALEGMYADAMKNYSKKQ